MSVQYGAISWNRQKKVYDVTLLSLLALYLGTFVGVGDILVKRTVRLAIEP
jgi:hypothetical protein